MRKILLFVLFLIWNFAVHAQITLTECVKIALQNNPALRISETEVLMTLEDVRQSRSALLPSLDFSGSYRRQSATPELTIPPIQLPIGGPPISLFSAGGMKLGMLDNYDFKLTVSQPIFTGFRLHNRIKAAKANASTRSMELEKNRCELIYKVETAYGHVMKAQKFLQIAMSAKEQVKFHVDDVSKFMAQGLAKKDELLKVQVKLSDAELAVIQAENSVQMSRVVLENLLGQKLPSDAIYSSLKLPDESLPEIDESIRTAQAERAELKALEYAKEVSAAAKKIASGGRLPSLAAFGSLGYGKPGLDFIKKEWMDYWLIGIGAEWNLWNWGKTGSQVQQAELRMIAINETERQVRDAIILDVTQACLHLEETTKRLQLTVTIEAQALESFRVTENNYKQGQATHSDFFDAQSELTRAQLLKAQAEIEAALAMANWRRAVGINEKEYQ